MNRSIYSLLLMDDVVQAVDQLAYAQNTSRSNMINQILAEYLSVKTPEQRMHDIFEQIETMMVQQKTFQIQFQPSDAMLSVRTALAYKYKPTVRYSIELFRNDPKILGELRVSARTQNAGLLRMLDYFFSIMAGARKPLSVGCLSGRCSLSDSKRPILPDFFLAGRNLHQCAAGRRHQFLYSKFRLCPEGFLRAG